MRKMLIVAAVLVMTVATVSPAEAGRRNRRRGYTRTRTTYQQTSQRTGFFARLMEFERRKNAFLFGR